ncbi:MAG TPA: hypothetical protein VF063_10695 [Gaiellaceae bacterium]
MPEPSIKDLLASSSFAFTGVVEAAGRSTVASIPADERTVVVRVSEVLHAPPRVRLPPGSRVTVQLSPELPTLEPGASSTFFAEGLAYGETLAVAEIGRTAVEDAAASTEGMADMAAPVSPVQAELAALEADKVVEHAQEADAVIRGHVVALAHAPTEGQPREHDANWWIATFEVDVLVRGELPGGAEAGATTSALYANSLDVRWRDAPKPKAGQAGLWLLHRARPELANLAPFELTHAIDRQPSLQLEVLRERGVVPKAAEEEDAEEDTGA